MKAAVNTAYGAPGDVLEVIDIPKPSPKSDELLIKVHASSVNRTDGGFIRAKPWIIRFFSGIFKPIINVLGNEFAGEVEQIGESVTLFSKGDKVFGFDDLTHGGHAEYMTISESRMVAIKPGNISFEQAAASSEGGHYAYGYVQAILKLKAKRVLVYGATGAIGTAAVQLLKYHGIEVVATANTKNIKLVSSLGADRVINWEKEDYSKIKDYQGYFDVVFDSVGKSSYRQSRPVLKKGGIYIATELGFLAQNPILSIFSPIFRLLGLKRLLFPMPSSNKQVIEYIRARLENKEFVPVIDSQYPLVDIVKAYKYVESGQKTGNVVIKL